MKFNTWSVTPLTAIMLTAAVAAAGEWPNWRGPNHDGISKETAWDPAAVSARKVAWEAQVGVGYSAVAVTNGKVYTAGNFNKDTDALSCLDAASGKQLWRHEYPEPLAPKFYSGGCSATPTVHDGKVYFASKSGKVFCLNADTGKVIWNKEFGRKPPTWGFASSALIRGKAVIFNAGSSGMAYDKDSGSRAVRQKHPHGGGSHRRQAALVVSLANGTRCQYCRSYHLRHPGVRDFRLRSRLFTDRFFRRRA
jgi:hypothetical protein